eukprot:TRINITY_DN116040_c0_g1_i1.p1 TRINITY_DN116040_c0_g1~~TRINITY_DN116040_c0_g1_i1.p1  ORF type:complete len:114 (-),score=19.46 TRINITY_DN116040_c0_g1_i1:146-487(-)
MSGATLIPRINVATFWRRMYKLSKPMTQAQATQFKVMGWLTALTWPGIAWFAKYTMEMEEIEHPEHRKHVNKNYPYMNNPNNIVYTWGTPCTFLDFECSYKHRKALRDAAAEE